ncbi:MAG: benzoate-CoA ligase family protein [Pseudomonadota bacterium]
MAETEERAGHAAIGGDSQTNENAALWFVDRHGEGALADKVAFIEGDGAKRSLTYKDLSSESGKLAALYERHGLRPEDRAAVLVLDQIEFPIIFWGSLKAGVIPVALNTLLSAEIYNAILLDCRARALFVSAALYPVVEPILSGNPYLQAIFVIGDKPPKGTLGFASELAGCETRPTVTVSGGEGAFWLYSSGSTGIPKGVCHVHSNLKATVDTYSDQVLQMREDDIVYSAAKLFFAYGLGNAMTFPMSVGATTWLLSGRPAPDSVFALLSEARPTMFFGVPTLYAAMLAQMNEETPGMDRLRLGISAGEALPAEIGRKWHALTNTDILDGVGSTEMLHIFLSNRSDSVVYGTSGLAVPGYDLRLVDEKDEDVKPGEVGELLVKGASAASGYWNRREKTRTTFLGEWTRTGDKYEQSEDGRLIYCGRTDDMFKVSGIWVAPFEVEQALVSHSSVLEAAVVAARDEEGLEKPKAFVVLQEETVADGLDDLLKEHVKDAIGKWKYPRWIEFVDDLPKTATGKIQRFKLRA